MSTNWASVDVRCPFYRNNESTQVSCEGIWPGSTVTVTRFRSSKQTLEHMRRLCMSRYTQCRLYSRIEEKYEDRLEPPYADTQGAKGAPSAGGAPSQSKGRNDAKWKP